MRRGFTLIELLAVIAILSIILLIVVPIMNGIIYNSKEKTKESSVTLYGRAIENAINDYYVKYPLKQKVSLEDLEIGGFLKYNGNRVECDTVQIKNRDVYLADCKVGSKAVDATYGKMLIFSELKSDADNDGKVSVGDKYTYKVNDNITFDFYVLSFNLEDDTVNLIMDRNICEDGTANYTSTNSCNYKWYAPANSAISGPTTAMQILYNATKDWTNVPNMDLVYDDVEDNIKVGYNASSETKSFEINIMNGVGKIIKNDKSEATSVGLKTKPLKARLPKYSEIILNSTCNANPGSCPAWLVDNLRSDNNYPINSEHDSNIYREIIGYWTLSSNLDIQSAAYYVYKEGLISSHATAVNDGIRPVITIPISDL